MDFESDIENREAILGKYIYKLHLREISKYKPHWRLLSQTLPKIEEVIKLFQDLFTSQESKEPDQNLKEIQFLQYLLIAIDAPANLFMEEAKWSLVKDLMPTQKTKLQIKLMANSFQLKSAYKNPWQKNEDKVLKKIISTFSLNNKGKKWSKIAQKLAEFSNFNFIRTPKQCRERWSNKLNPMIQRDEWTDDEELYFFELLLQKGKKWAEISSRLSTLTENKKRTEFALKHKYRKLIPQNEKTVQQDSGNSTYQISPVWKKEQVQTILKVIHKYRKVVPAIDNPREYSENYTLSPLIQKVRKGTENQLAVIWKNKIEFIDIGILNTIMENFLSYSKR